MVLFRGYLLRVANTIGIVNQVDCGHVLLAEPASTAWRNCEYNVLV